MSKGISRRTLRLPEELNEQMEYWSKKKNVSANEYIVNAIELQIRHENKDYDIPELEVQRLNQMFDLLMSFGDRIKTLELIVTKGFSSIIELTRGTNYLLDEDGDGHE